MQDSKDVITGVLFDIPLSLCSLESGIKLVEEVIAGKTPSLIVLANAHTFNIAYVNSDYKEVIKKARIVFRDGVGVEWALKRRGFPGLHNYVGTDFIPAFCNKTAHKEYRFYLLGAKPGISEQAAKNLESLAPGIVIAGLQHGYFPDQQTGEIISRINASKADVLLVAMGNPKQEFWISANLNKLNVPVCIGVGALFDYLSGTVSRAPQWMLDAKMEWFYRLLIEPRRLWKRYLIGNVKFVIRFNR